jgi:hypothetical protein
LQPGIVNQFNWILVQEAGEAEARRFNGEQGWLLMMLIISGLDAVLPQLSVTVTVCVVEEVGWIGVPEMTPVVGFKFKPLGNGGLML